MTQPDEFTPEEKQQLAAELCGLQPEQILDLKLFPDRMAVIIFTGQKYVFTAEQIDAALGRLEKSLGTVIERVMRTQLDDDAAAVLAKAPEPPHPGRGGSSAKTTGKTKDKPAGKAKTKA